MENQIKAQFHKAFKDLLTENLSGESPDWNWLVSLYAELRDRLCSLTPRRPDLAREIHESMDIELFRQMITNDAFKPEDMWKLVLFVFDRIKNLEAPARSKQTVKTLENLYQEFIKPGTTIATFVPNFIFTANKRIDFIYEDIKNLGQALNGKKTAKNI